MDLRPGHKPVLKKPASSAMHKDLKQIANHTPKHGELFEQ